MTQGFSVVEQSPAYSQKPGLPDSNVTVLTTQQPTRNAATAEIFCESVFNTQPGLFLTQLQGGKCLGESCSLSWVGEEVKHLMSLLNSPSLV